MEQKISGKNCSANISCFKESNIFNSWLNDKLSSYISMVRLMSRYIQMEVLTSQKQPFTDVLQNSCSWKFWNIHRKTPVLESLLKSYMWMLRNFKSSFNIEHLRWLLLTLTKIYLHRVRLVMWIACFQYDSELKFWVLTFVDI